MISESFAEENVRLAGVLDRAWDICVRRIAAGRITINKEASLQLHLGSILKDLGEAACIHPSETFFIELETKHGKKNIDIYCTLGDVHAALELKCFRKSSNRAMDMDMYDCLKDIQRLESLPHAELRRFICLTDNPYYPNASHGGHAGTVSIADGRVLRKGILAPTWKGKWKDHSRDVDLPFQRDHRFEWHALGGWFYLYMAV
jgi:hypothetical protein